MEPIFKTILAVLFPEYCLGCRRAATALCERCAFALPHSVALLPNTAAALDYADQRVRKAVRLFKYRNKRSLARVFALILADMLHEELAEQKLISNFSLPLLVPIPISGARFRERGYNQCLLLARELALLLGGSVALEPDALRKSRHTASQVKTMSKKERLENLSGSFAAVPDKVKGRNIVLLDDVITTGATMAEARRALKQAGAKKVFCVALAH